MIISEFLNYLPESVHFITEKSQLPAPVAGVITLPANGDFYIFTRVVDLTGDTLVVNNNSLMGSSQELGGVENATVQVNDTCTINAFRFNNCQMTINVPSGAFDWSHVNFYDSANCLNIVAADNVVLDTIGFINSSGAIIYGTLNSFVMTNSIFRSVTNPTATLLEIGAAAVINRRIRIQDSVFATDFAGQTSFKFTLGATIGDESLLMNTVRFTGAGTALDGINGNDDRAVFRLCQGTGVINTGVKGYVYMTNNAVATTVLGIGDLYEAAGTKTLNTTYAQRFALNSNRLEYTSALPRQVIIQLSGTLTSASNNVVGTYIGIARNGNPVNPAVDAIPESEMYITMSGTRPDNVFCQCITELNQGDRIYAITENTTAINDITYTFLNWIVREA